MFVTHIKIWSDAIRLALNVEKSSYIIFLSPQKSLNDNVDLRIGKQHVHRATYVKFLGLLLDEIVSWNYYLTELSNKLMKVWCIF